jgi:hypothetical protein
MIEGSSPTFVGFTVDDKIKEIPSEQRSCYFARKGWNSHSGQEAWLAVRAGEEVSSE